MPSKLKDKLKDKYVTELKRRGKESHVYTKFQLIGLEISQILNDEKHKALYIKLAKDNNPEMLLGLAKDVAERSNINNKGAYFMSLVTGTAKKPTGPFVNPYAGKNPFAAAAPKYPKPRSLRKK
jgi:hypothetical protein